MRESIVKQKREMHYVQGSPSTAGAALKHEICGQPLRRRTKRR